MYLTHNVLERQLPEKSPESTGIRKKSHKHQVPTWNQSYHVFKAYGTSLYIHYANLLLMLQLAKEQPTARALPFQSPELSETHKAQQGGGGGGAWPLAMSTYISEAHSTSGLWS